MDAAIAECRVSHGGAYIPLPEGESFRWNS